MDKYLLLYRLFIIAVMKGIFENLKRPLLAVLLFLLAQLVVSFVLMFVAGVYAGIAGKDIQSVSVGGGFMGIASLLSNVLVVFISLKMFGRKSYSQDFQLQSQPSGWLRNVIALLGCVFGVIAMDLFSEILSLPNIMEKEIMGMLGNPWGIAAIAIGAPLGEELLFRWGIQGHLLRRGCSVPLSIVLSALLFGLAHINPAQVFFAFIMGILLGLLYWRSGSLWLPILLHALNNGTACLQVWLLGDEAETFSMVEAVGGQMMACINIVVLSLACAGVMWWYVKGTRE